MTLEIRQAKAGDGAVLHAMVRELAVNHGHERDFTAVPQDYERVLAEVPALVGAFIGFWNGEPAGCAIWQRSYSTFRGRETLYLQDLSVLPQFRNLGVGTALLKTVARFAGARKFEGVTWLMMSWNENARRVYAAAGAEIEDGYCHCRLSGAALERLAQ